MCLYLDRPAAPTIANATLKCSLEHVRGDHVCRMLAIPLQSRKQLIFEPFHKCRRSSSPLLPGAEPKRCSGPFLVYFRIPAPSDTLGMLIELVLGGINHRTGLNLLCDDLVHIAAAVSGSVGDLLHCDGQL